MNIQKRFVETNRRIEHDLMPYEEREKLIYENNRRKFAMRPH